MSRTLRSAPGCSFLLEAEMAKHVVIYCFMGVAQHIARQSGTWKENVLPGVLGKKYMDRTP